MKLTIVDSGSKANCYLFTDSEKNTLIVEAGADPTEALDFDYSGVVGCIITHEHADHSKYFANLQHKGIASYCSLGTFNALTNVFRPEILKPNKSCIIGPYTVLPFNVQHDAKEPLGFVISHKEMGNCLFLTDTSYCKYQFEGLNQIIIEANYSNEYLSGPKFLNERVIRSHMSLHTCKEYLQVADLTAVNNIVLIHLSNGNSHAENFKKEIGNIAPGKTVNVAEKGMTLDFNLTPM